jgi:hypothetical protein
MNNVGIVVYADLRRSGRSHSDAMDILRGYKEYDDERSQEGA